MLRGLNRALPLAARDPSSGRLSRAASDAVKDDEPADGTREPTATDGKPRRGHSVTRNRANAPPNRTIGLWLSLTG